MAGFHLLNRDSLLEATRLFVRATELDPNYASPYGMASWSGALRNSFGWMVDRESEIADAVRLARRAVAVGKDDPTALWSGGLSLAYLGNEVEAAAAYIDRALVLNPNLAARLPTRISVQSTSWAIRNALITPCRSFHLSNLDMRSAQR